MTGMPLTPVRRLTLVTLMAIGLLSAAAEARIPADPPQGRFHDVWMAMMMGAQQMGYLNVQYIREGDDIRIVSRTAMKMARDSAVIEISVAETTVESITGQPKSFVSETQMAATPTRLRGTIDGNKVKVVSEMFGQELEQEFDFPVGATMGWGTFLKHREHTPAPGVELKVDVYAPSQALNVGMPTTIKVEAKEDVELDGTTYPAYRAVTTTMLNGMEIVATGWVDDDWEPIKQSLDIMGIKFDMVRCDKKTALRKMAPVEMFTTSLLPIGRRIDRARTRAITFKFARPDDGKMFEVPVTGMQEVKQEPDGLIVRVTRPTRDTLASAGGGTLTDAKEYLEPSVFINSTDPDVVKMAARAAGDETDPLRVAERLRETVSREVKYVDLGTGFASAAEVCRSKVGDCTENGVLLAALGRARGIPSRVVTGLIYVPLIAGEKDVMGFHMWTQFWINGRWVDMDAAWDQSICDPTHIALGTHSTRTGSLASLVSGAMLRLDNLRIEVVKVDE